MRQREQLSPDEMRELDALDRVLSGDPVDADLRELEDLVHDIRASAPEMTPAFAARLEQEVSDGFPTKGQVPKRHRPKRWMLLPAAGTLATVAIVLPVVFGGGNNGELGGTRTELDSAGRVESSAEPSAVAEDSATSDPAPSGAATGATAQSAPAMRQAVPAPHSPEIAGQGADRRKSAPGGASAPQAAAPGVTALDRATATPKIARNVQRSALLVLESPNAEFESTSDGVIRTVDRFGGIVQSSSIGSRDESGEATFELRIPTDRLDQALAALSKLGHVAERSQHLQDITGSFTSAQDRLSDARAERRGLLRALGRATTPLQIETLRTRLRFVRSTIARLNGELNSLRRRAGLATVQLTVRATGKKADEGTGGGTWTPGDAARDAVRVLEVIAGVTLIALAIAAPLALLGVAVMLAVRVGRRRRREGALDPA